MVQPPREARRDLRRDLTHLEDLVVTALSSTNLGIYEGHVMTVGPPPYRRLDCRRRALAYLRLRLKKGALRIDVSGLWPIPRSSKIEVPSASGGKTLMVRTRDDATEAIEFLKEVVMAK